MLSGAKAVIADPNDEVSLIAAIAGVPIYAPHSGDGALVLQKVADASSLLHAISSKALVNPYTGDAMSIGQVVELCGFWRSLIDSNRDLAGGLGFAFWKQGNVAPLLWGGGKSFEFLSAGATVADGKSVAVWRSKAPEEAIARLEQAGTPLVEVEDGFLRSQGLGADCVPPLSITVDGLGAYFDHSRPSELENLLQNTKFDGLTLDRSRKLRAVMIDGGLSKYGAGISHIERPSGIRRLILVPGQVEDDRSVMTGGGGMTNLQLLERVRADAPDAFILYKPHPDVLAGHRKGAIPDRPCLELADQIIGDASVTSLIEMVDEVHVNTSLTGFEALLREKPVVTYGVPFYAGWGLTRDLGPVPARRTAKRTLDELVAATLLVYPRYLDPVTGLPCPAEIVVDRLCGGATRKDGWVVKLRRLQGKIVRGLRGVSP
jgi:capsular polysaccharide export protein